jgi:hypothetical protein
MWTNINSQAFSQNIKGRNTTKLVPKLDKGTTTKKRELQANVFNAHNIQILNKYW